MCVANGNISMCTVHCCYFYKWETIHKGTSSSMTDTQMTVCACVSVYTYMVVIV